MAPKSHGSGCCGWQVFFAPALIEEVLAIAVTWE